MYKMVNQLVISFQKKYEPIVCITLAICTLIFSKTLLAEQYQLKQIADFSEFNQGNSGVLWLDPLVSPSNNGDYFVAQNNGLLNLIGKDVKNGPKAILNLSEQVKTSDFISLTSMTLHPSFARPEQFGYGVIFTAHTTELDPVLNNNRLTLRDTEVIFDYETVVTAWQYDFDTQSIDPKTQREVLRIPIKSQDSAIQNLKFDPYQKPWNADYGQLYFSLKYVEELKYLPLYSGAILRIDPEVFGANNYTTPKANPFINNPKINNEIVIMGAQNIRHFFWAKHDHASIYIQHNKGVQHRISQAKIGDNLLSQASFVWQQSSTMSSILLYQGRSFLNLRNKMVFFTSTDNQWYLNSLGLKPLNNESPEIEEFNYEDGLLAGSHLTVLQGSEDEIILFDNHKYRIYSLQSTHVTPTKADEPQLDTRSEESKGYSFYILLLLVLLSIFIYRKNTSKKNLKNPLEKNHIRFKYEPYSQTILLFKNEQKNVYKSLSINDVIRCEVLLNNNIIHTLDEQPRNAISNHIETQLRDIFTTEHFDKMVDDKIRQIEIILTNNDESYTACLYLRIGNNRVTGAKYHDAVDTLIDLCWDITKCINLQESEERIIPVVAVTAIPQSRNQKTVKKSIAETTTPETVTSNPEGQIPKQTEVIDSLDKLVNLHKQGYLSDEEFSLAKAKILQ